MFNEPKRALVAEDNAALARVVELTLRRSGFEVERTADGAAAWGCAQKQAFDLIISDHQMPRMTGLELCEQLRASDLNRSTPVVLLTAKGLELDADRLRAEYGVARVMIKPFSPTELSVVATDLATAAV